MKVILGREEVCKILRGLAESGIESNQFTEAPFNGAKKSSE